MRKEISGTTIQNSYEILSLLSVCYAAAEHLEEASALGPIARRAGALRGALEVVKTKASKLHDQLEGGGLDVKIQKNCIWRSFNEARGD